MSPPAARGRRGAGRSADHGPSSGSPFACRRALGWVRSRAGLRVRVTERRGRRAGVPQVTAWRGLPQRGAGDSDATASGTAGSHLSPRPPSSGPAWPRARPAFKIALKPRSLSKQLGHVTLELLVDEPKGDSKPPCERTKQPSKVLRRSHPHSRCNRRCELLLPVVIASTYLPAALTSRFGILSPFSKIPPAGPGGLARASASRRSPRRRPSSLSYVRAVLTAAPLRRNRLSRRSCRVALATA